MAAERHLPGRESEEHDSVGLQEFFQTKEKGRLVLRLDVLYDIVDGKRAGTRFLIPHS